MNRNAVRWVAVAACGIVVFVVATLVEGFRMGSTASSIEMVRYVEDNAARLVTAVGLAILGIIAVLSWSTWRVFRR